MIVFVNALQVSYFNMDTSLHNQLTYYLHFLVSFCPCIRRGCKVFVLFCFNNILMLQDFWFSIFGRQILTLPWLYNFFTENSVQLYRWKKIIHNRDWTVSWISLYYVWNHFDHGVFCCLSLILFLIWINLCTLNNNLVA